MPISPRPTAAVAALFLFAAALAGCTFAASPGTAAPSQSPGTGHSSEPSATPAAAAGSTVCTSPAWIDLRHLSARLTGELQDLGAREFAAGDVGVDDEGRITSYTVAPGDVSQVIGERLCIRDGGVLDFLNHVRTIQPNQVLWLRPDPDVPWVPYLNPEDAPEGFLQIPYQQTIEAMGVAADAGDVAAMRATWADVLRGMFTNPDDIEAIQRALDAGDLDVLRQMFS